MGEHPGDGAVRTHTQHLLSSLSMGVFHGVPKIIQYNVKDH